MSKINFTLNGVEYAIPKVEVDALFAKMDKALKALNYSIGLEFTSNGDGTCYVSGLGECTDLEVIVPIKSPDGERVVAIGDDAFYQKNFTSFIIPDSITTVGSYAFDECGALKSITFGNSVTTIKASAFFYCNSLTEITIPETVAAIGLHAFDTCLCLSSITFAGTIEQWNAIEKGGRIAEENCPVTYIQCSDGQVAL